MQSQPIQDALDSTRVAAQRVQPDRDSPKVQTNDVERLKQLIQSLRSIAASLPPELQGLISGLIAQAEAALTSGDPVSISHLISKLEEALDVLQEILRLLARGESAQASEAIKTLIARMLGQKKVKDQMFRQQDATMEASLEAMMNLKFGNL